MSWTPPESASYYFLENDPETGNYSGDQLPNQEASYLTMARQDAFGAVERGLSATAQLAQTVADGLRGADAERDDWEGDAASSFHDKLGDLPKQLDQVHSSYESALSALATFATTTFELQAKYRSWQSDLDSFRTTWQSATAATYPDEPTGQAKLKALRNELDRLCARRTQILGWNDDAGNTFQAAIEKLVGEAPHVHESELQKLLSPITDFLHAVTGTWGAIKAFAQNQTWENFDKLTEDLAADASIVVLAVGAPEALAGVGLLDAAEDSTLLTVTEVTGKVATGLDTAATAGNVTAKEFDKQYGAGAFEALLVLVPGGNDLATKLSGNGELEKTIGEAKLVAGYKSALDSGKSPDAILASLPPDEAAALKSAIPKYRDPAAVNAATTKISAELQDVRKTAGLVEAPKGFVWENGVLVPAAKAAGTATGGGTGNGDHHGD